MTLEKTIQSMFDDYPIIFQDRVDCLNHLFCVLGNSYEWKNGELVIRGEIGEPRKPKNELVNGRAVQHTILTKRSEYLLACKISELPVNEEHLKSLPDEPVRKRPRKERWYFNGPGIPGRPREIDLYKEYVPLWNIPAGIKPDWLAGVQECKAMLLEDGIIQESDMD